MPNHPRVDTLSCPFCGCARSRVRDTATNVFHYREKKHTRIRRKRLCSHCKLYYTTVELIESEDFPGTPQVFVQDLHPIDKANQPPPPAKPPLPHPLDIAELPDSQPYASSADSYGGVPRLAPLPVAPPPTQSGGVYYAPASQAAAGFPPEKAAKPQPRPNPYS